MKYRAIFVVRHYNSYLTQGMMKKRSNTQGMMKKRSKNKHPKKRTLKLY